MKQHHTIGKKAKKVLAIGIIVLFLGTSLAPALADRSDETMLLKNDSSPDRTTTEDAFEQDGNTEMSFQDYMHTLFSHMNLAQFPSGVLLELGGALYSKTIHVQDGQHHTEPTWLSKTDFCNVYDALVRSSIKRQLPNYADLKATSQRFIEEHHQTALTIAAISYETILPEAFTDGRITFDGEYLHEPTDGQPFYETRMFYGSSALIPTVYGPDTEFIIPSELVISNSPRPITLSDLRISFFDTDIVMDIMIDRPFKIHNLQGDQQGDVRFSLFGVANGNPFTTYGSFCYMPLTIPLHYDMGVVEASVPYNGVHGKINVRIYPAHGSVTGSPGTYQPSLRNVMYIVDGFDVKNNRTQDTIWKDFGNGMQHFLDMGFDLISVDYTVGNDYIQRNGLAIRELFKKMPGWMESGLENQPAVVMAGSMGTQTARYALRTAELANEDHHVGLFVAIDGPFKGANIPISLQGFVTYFADLFGGEAQELLDGLNSPAASQLLIKNRNGNVWYSPRQDYIDYYSEVNSLGLPLQHCRNVALASGSGYGTRLSSSSTVSYGHVDCTKPVFLGLMKTVWRWLPVPGWYPEPIFHQTGAIIDMYSDKPGIVFDAWMGIHPFYEPTLSVSLSCNQCSYIDLAPGGTRDSIVDAVNTFNDATIVDIPNWLLMILMLHSIFVIPTIDFLDTMTYDLGCHCFIPTYSALGIDLSAINNNLNYAPASDPNLSSKTPFDSVFYEVENCEHVEDTPEAMAYITNELLEHMKTMRISHVGDFNGDGLDDLLLQNRFPGGKTYLLNGGSTSLTSPLDITTSYWMNSDLWADSYRKLHTGDFNGDGKTDLLLQNRLPQGHSSYILNGTSTGFEHAWCIDTRFSMNRALWADQYIKLHTGDFNGDGRTDILLQNRPTSNINSYLLMANFIIGGFYDKQLITSSYGMSSSLWADYYRILHVGDFNGDGKDDVLLQNRHPEWDSTYILNGTSTGFTYRWVVDTRFSMSRGYWSDQKRILHTGDFNGDGRTDLLLQNRIPYLDTLLLIAKDTGGFHPKIIVTNLYWMNSDLWADSYRKLHTGDFNGDGKTDLLLQNRYPDYHHTYLLNGTSTGFSNADAITTQYGMNYALWAADNMVLQVGDFTSKYVSDHMDILLIARPGRSSYILKNKGNGFFKTHVALP